MNIAEIVVDVIHSDVDRIFDYKIPNNLNNIQIGMEVLVPFGGRMITGFIVGLKSTSLIQKNKLRNIKAVLHEGTVLINEDLVDLAKKMANYYMVPLAMALECIVPGG
ncbi:hypothetical protein [Clostridium sp. 'deep sea']|uniref:primosomal protein N' family DNA-binding protein n=1 Tax=Clostridium sp. 'deep sea' TaxID=2779445 RepID=UPI001FAB86A4|nr:hypothetical protein [Clostridium sp. 'deep sea']